jgi:hypothetical protein
MQSKDDFRKRESDARTMFIRNNSAGDYDQSAGSVGYSREYKCECGFTTSDPDTIFDHECEKES